MSQHYMERAEEQNRCRLSNECDSALKIQNQGLPTTTNELFELHNRLALPETQNMVINGPENENITLQPVMGEGPSENLELHYRKHKLRSSTIRTRKQQAVCVRNAYKYYGSKKEPVVILDKLNMTVPKGVIYGLLGASGCGKTTLLSCIVGRRRLNSGEIWVLGGTPGSKGSGVPGPRIGYMPQDTALYGEFTIRETLVYFGWIAGMTTHKIQQRMDFLMNLLMLTNVDKRVKELSGGEQRRVSLAASLVHEPELLILDEPTVGLDPVLRETIWNHFLDITKDGHTTVIITTHYIDETRQAHLIALLRGGYFLAEESPGQLLRHFGLDALEDVFLKLSVKQNSSSNRQRITIGQQSTATIVEAVEHQETITVPVDGNINETFVSDEADYRDCGKLEDNSTLGSHCNKQLSMGSFANNSNDYLPKIPPKSKSKATSSDYLLVCDGNHMRALLWKNFLWIMRNIPIMLVMLLLPFVQSVLFCVCIGNDPIDLTVAVVNYETDNIMKCGETLSCNTSLLSCSYLQYLEERGLILIPYNDEVSARDSVLMGKTYASIVVRHNYSIALRARFEEWQEAKSWDIVSSEIDVFRDVSNKLIANHVRVLLYETFQSFLQDYMVSCDMDSRWVTVPIKWGVPVYGKDVPSFTEFVAPGLLVTFTCFLAVGLTSITMLMERSEGSLERSLVIGISGIELLMSHTICQFIIMVLQAFITMVSLFALFNITVRGSLTLVVVLTLLTGFCGMCYGFVISCICTTVTTAFFIAMGSFLPMVILGGILWPIEGMHSILQVLVVVFPLTQITESLRSVMQRGWGFSEEVVYMGAVTISIWIVIFLSISILYLKFKKD